MEYLNPDLDITRQLIDEIKRKRLNQLKGLYMHKAQLGNSHLGLELSVAIPIAEKISIAPLWPSWLNQQLTNNYNSISNDALILQHECISASNDTKEWIIALLGWDNFSPQFQSVCPEGYSVGFENDKSKWVDVLQEAFAIIHDGQAELYNEMRLSLLAIIPLIPGRQAHPSFSFSTPNRFGTIFMTFDLEARVMADILVHEYFHNRLNLLMNSHAVLVNSESEEYYSPWRMQPRPLWGILHGSYASYGIINFWKSYLETPGIQIPEKERVKIKKGVIKTTVALQLGNKTLMRHARPTKSGKILLTELNKRAGHFLDWACSMDSILVSEYYNEYHLMFESWKRLYQKPGAVFENIF